MIYQRSNRQRKKSSSLNSPLLPPLRKKAKHYYSVIILCSLITQLSYFFIVSFFEGSSILSHDYSMWTTIKYTIFFTPSHQYALFKKMYKNDQPSLFFYYGVINIFGSVLPKCSKISMNVYESRTVLAPTNASTLPEVIIAHAHQDFIWPLWMVQFADVSTWFED